MALLILLVLFGLVLLFAVIVDKVRDRRLYRKAELAGRDIVMIEDRPACTINVNLEDCELYHVTEYREPVPTRRTRYDHVLKNSPDPASRRSVHNVMALKYTTEYKGMPVTFVSGNIYIDAVALRVKMTKRKTTTISIYEDRDGKIEDYDFDLGFI